MHEEIDDPAFLQTYMMATKRAHPLGAAMQTAKLARNEIADHHTGTTLTYKVMLSTNGEEIKDFYLTLESKNQSSDKILVKKPYLGGFRKEVSFDVCVEKVLGDIVQVKLEMDNSQWFCRHIRVKSPSGKCFEFPCYRWLDQTQVIIREGRARLPQDDTDLLKKQRREELESRQEIFRWKQWHRGFPQSIDATLADLPLDVRFDEEKDSNFTKDFRRVFVNSSLDSFKGHFESWNDIADFENIFGNYNLKNTLLENVIQDWNTDYMFGYQFLNGCNPVMIRKCKELPDKFPVTHEMVEGCLQRGLTLQEEIKAGNIYIADYEILEGVPANKKHPDSPYYLTAPICLLYNNRLNQIVPIAIQLSQHSGKTSPIFLPNDDEHDWMLAKMWVKSSDFNLHQLVTHLLKTHLISEVFEMAMLRQLSAVHPVYKLLIPHVRFTIAINAEAREKLLNEDGVISKISSVSGPGIEEVMKRAMDTFTYKSLCFPEAIKARGMEDAPKYYYRDDGMKIWEAINCFVSDVVKIYYDSDEMVQKDVEIQKFVTDVSFGMNDSDNFPKSLKTQGELAEYLTAVIFTASAQHSALNFGQFEWYGWIPNSPSTMRKPPPQQKGQVDLQYIMDTLPDRDCSRELLGTIWGLTRFQSDELFLGMYPDVHFTEQPMKEAIKTFRKKLDEVTHGIKLRNEGLTMDYCYLSPDKIPNSVAI
ncbi:polyunsaturated fatty acid 5-lipoxygenase-like [Pseudorasbora parva]|uniref:polyunsaturated fatty acid 5-lipoxygenase-like n=1 Tax=Pseudorasbora parva TaxID=51549 RepID=UPI00351E99F1